MARRRKNLLYIDDNQTSLKTCKMILEHFGYTVLTASNSREGLEAFASNAIDAVILDYQMPEMDGERVAAEMRRTNPRVPILLLSGCPSLPDSALRRVDECIAKGDSVEFLLLAVEQLLSRADKRKTLGAVTHSRVVKKRAG
jgi:CheY-like chemotaxis protein